MAKNSSFFSEKKSWSLYKDKILKNYLRIFLQKIMKSPHKTIYIDAFAGQGKFDDGSDGSPIIVNKIIEEVENSSSVQDKMIYPFFIEKKYAKKLELAVGKYFCKVINGDYKTEVNKILDKTQNVNVFMYVDPFGIKDLDFSIFSKLSQNKNSVELLLNLNAFGFIREGCRLLGCNQDNELEDSAGIYDGDKEINDIANMNRVANTDKWQQIILKKKSGEISAKEAENLFTKLYVEQLSKIFKFVFSIPIRTGDSFVPKYQMVFATNHIQGALLMADNMIKCDVEMSNNGQDGQQSFFDYDHTISNIDQDIIDILLRNEIINVKDLCLSLYENGKFYFHKDIRKGLKLLEKEGLITIDRRMKKTKSGNDYTGLDFIKNDIYVRGNKNEINRKKKFGL